MKVKDLIAKLQEFDPEEEAYIIDCCYGDDEVSEVYHQEIYSHHDYKKNESVYKKALVIR